MKSKSYASITETEGVNYRDIAEVMTDIGFKMNHSSARNYVLRVMTKFVREVASQWDVELTEADVVRIAKSPQFQQGICEVLHSIEAQRSPTRGET